MSQSAERDASEAHPSLPAMSGHLVVYHAVTLRRDERTGAASHSQWRGSKVVLLDLQQ